MSPKGQILAGQEEAVIENQEQNSSQVCEERIKLIQNQISVLEGSLTNIQVALGRALETSNLNQTSSEETCSNQNLSKKLFVFVHKPTQTKLVSYLHPEVGSSFRFRVEIILRYSETPAS